jgi:hypothetical protein
VSEHKPYKTDLSDGQWALIAAWKAAHPSVSGHQGRYEMRGIVNALLYQGRTAASGTCFRTTCRRAAQPAAWSAESTSPGRAGDGDDLLARAGEQAPPPVAVAHIGRDSCH